MNKPFDTTLKDLLNVFAVDWADWLGPRIGLTADLEVEPLDVDLSTVQMSADKAFRLQPPAEGILHIEPQASWDGSFPGRLLRYSALLHDIAHCCTTVTAVPSIPLHCCCGPKPTHATSPVSSAEGGTTGTNITALNIMW